MTLYVYLGPRKDEVVVLSKKPKAIHIYLAVSLSSCESVTLHIGLQKKRFEKLDEAAEKEIISILTPIYGTEIAKQMVEKVKEAQRKCVEYRVRYPYLQKNENEVSQ